VSDTDLIIRPSSLAKPPKRNGPLPTPLAEYMAARSMPEPNSGCWLWTGTMFPNGYGMVRNVNARRGAALAHRVSYELHCQPIPDGLVIDHLCRNRCCVNPAHLEPVTFTENCVRGVGLKKGHAFQRAKTHCPKGHPYDEANTYWRKGGARGCRECGRQRSLRYAPAWRARQKAARDE
jgi:hypothetical protein